MKMGDGTPFFEHILYMTNMITAFSDTDYLENCRLPCIVKCMVDRSLLTVLFVKYFTSLSLNFLRY